MQGAQETALGATTADFVVRRKDGYDAYQLAVVVDDAWQGVTHVVRGSDLLDSTARQIFLQGLLGYPVPAYCHLPVITDGSGQKLSKQNHAPPLVDEQACANLRAALAFLGQPAPPDQLLTPAEILRFATGCWTCTQVPPVLSIAASSGQ